ncbi:MAG: hypothetical protein WCT27_03290, partial [Patescibacteria group bacterium]
TADYLHTIFALPFGSLFTVSAIDVYNYIAQKYIPKEKQLPIDITTDDLAALLFHEHGLVL